MKNIVEKLATGISNYEVPDADISENRIVVELEEGTETEGEIVINGKNNFNIKGIVFSTDNHIRFENNQFNGVNNRVKYIASSKNFEPSQYCSGTISVVTTGGDYQIPFVINVIKKDIKSTLGPITNLREFVTLVKESYDEALIIFLSKQFKKSLLKNDIHGLTIYNQAMKNGDRKIALEEFLVGMNLKERVVISVSDKEREYMDVMDNYGDSINIIRSVPGNVDIDVEVEGKFLYNCSEKVTAEDFNGKTAEYEYLINASKLHCGNNYGRIVFKTSNENIVYNIVVINKKENVTNYIVKKKNLIRYIKNYLDFRTGVIDGTAWKKNMLEMSRERLAYDPNDIQGLLGKTQIAVLDNDKDKAIEYFSTISNIMAKEEHKNIEEYCYYLYLKSVYKNNSQYTDEVTEEIREYFEGGHDSWELLWMLFYMDDRYESNISLKYTLVKRMFSSGCHSPIMYFEAANVLNKQPELLRVLNKFEVQVLNFAAKYHIVTEDLAKQAAEIMGKEKGFKWMNLDVLKRIYRDTRSKEILTCICQTLINGGKTSKDNFYWFKEGVVKELPITNLYEYYIYAVDTNEFPLFEKSVYQYFSYGTDTLNYNRDYYYSNLVTNFDEKSDIYKKSREGMERFATEQILAGKNNKKLQKIYERVLTDQFIVGEMVNKMPEILHTYEINVHNDNVDYVVVSHKEVTDFEKIKLENNKAFVHIYTKKPIISFIDKRGRVLADTKYELEQIIISKEINNVGSNDLMLLNKVEDIMKNPEKNSGRLKDLKAVLDIPNLLPEYRILLEEFIVDYYYKGYDNGDLELYILEFDLSKLSATSKNKVNEILVSRNMWDMVFPSIIKYGYENMSKDLLEKLCIELSGNEDYKDNELLSIMCGSAFRNGCRNENVLRYIGKYYKSSTIEMYQIFLGVKSKGIDDNTIAERLLVQFIFEGNTEEKIYDIFAEYLKGETDSVIRRAFFTYITYNHFVKRAECSDSIWEFLEDEIDENNQVTIISKIAFLDEMSKKRRLTDRQVHICQILLEELSNNDINFEFYKAFDTWFKIPFNLVDKTIIDYRTNPKDKVEITYSIKTMEGNTKPATEPMRGICSGVFTKEITMFYGEEIDYSITVYSEEEPEGKVATHSSLRINEKNIYNDESRFGMINGMMICKNLDRDEDAREIMQSYELYREAGETVFKLL